MKNFLILLAFIFAVSITVSAQSTEKKQVKKITKTTLTTDKKVHDKCKTTGTKVSEKKTEMKDCEEGSTSGCCSTGKTETVKKDQGTKEDQKK